jgi:LemA protein
MGCVLMVWITGLVCTGLVALAAVTFVVIVYNGLVRARNAFRNAFAQIDVQLTRRHDLIPNLVETAKGYLKHERETLDTVVRARTAAVSAQAAVAGGTGDLAAIGLLAGAENLLSQALGQMFALAEAYPDLKANQNMLRLQEELTTTENRVAFARQAYNDAVLTYNTRRQVFPSSLIAGIFSFQPAQLFEIDDPQQRQTPNVSF